MFSITSNQTLKFIVNYITLTIGRFIEYDSEEGDWWGWKAMKPNQMVLFPLGISSLCMGGWGGHQRIREGSFAFLAFCSSNDRLVDRQGEV